MYFWSDLLIFIMRTENKKVKKEKLKRKKKKVDGGGAAFEFLGRARIWEEIILNQSSGGCLAQHSINTIYVL